MAVESLLGILLVTTFTAVGVVTICAIRSRVHWFLCTAIVLGILSPLLAVPALEPFVTLLLEAFVIATAVLFQRMLAAVWPDEKQVCETSLKPRGRVRFSLATFLLVIGLSSILLAIGTYMPELNWNTWLTMGLIGIGAGVCVTLGYAGASSFTRWFVRWPVVILVALFAAAPLAWFDWFVPSITGFEGWPPEEVPWGGAFIGILSSDHPVLLWFVVCTTTSLLSAAWFAAVAAGDSRIARIARGSLVCVCLVPGYVLWVLLTPDPIPMADSSLPNTYDEIIETARIVAESKFEDVRSDWESIPEEELAASLVEIQDTLTAVRPILRMPSWVPVDYTNEDIPVDRYMQIHSLADALTAQGKVELVEGKPDNACTLFLDAARLGFCVRSEGLLIDDHFGRGCTEMVARQLYKHRRAFSPQALQVAISEVLALAEAAETYEEFKRRDRIWAQHSQGWHGRLQLLLFETTGSYLLFSEKDLETESRRGQARLRLLATELAIQIYYVEHGEWPESLADLVPDYLPSVLKDPFDERHGPLQYIRLNATYILYSLDADGTDEGGQPSYSGESGFLYLPHTGDLSLDMWEDEAGTE